MLLVSLFYTLNQFFLSFLTLQSPYILLLTTFLLLFQFPSSVHYLASDTFSFLLPLFYYTSDSFCLYPFCYFLSHYLTFSFQFFQIPLLPSISFMHFLHSKI